MRKMSLVCCDGCSIKFEKETRYVKAGQKKRNNKNYCSLSCYSKFTYSQKSEKLSEWNNSEQNKAMLKTMAGNKKDEYTGFRTLLASCKKRNKDCDIDLPFLKCLWEQQKGKCAITGVDLELKRSYNKNYQASIDRIDSKKGYIKGNIRFTSVSVNWLKSDLDDNHLREFFQITNMVV
jgi:hypothetical protein